ncbi:unnamed protein product [Triticum turgidum subsp. durum]|uniref:Uncharacterized protein n=1 Tax=Triticum turgidum subsp. durum TaxID=4567 RepID=A0A9R0RAT7_TRITD|nr:unnamed protein product [Triticum turgidum subsp. durum]
MADLLVQARNKLLEGDGMAGATGDAGKGKLFCTGSGRPVSLSERAIRKARALVGEDVEKAGIKRKQSFGDVPDVEGGLREMGAPFRGVRLGGTMPPLFQTGSGKAVLPGRNSIQKARAILEGVDGMEQFPLFQTGSGRVVSVSSASVQKAKSVLKDNNTSKENTESFGRPDHTESFGRPDQTGSRRPVMISERSIERSIDAVNEGDAEKSGHWDTGCQFPMFQTGLGKPVAVSWNSVQKARAVLEEEKIKTTGHGDSSFCATTLQSETPRSVLMSSSLIMTDRSVTPNGDSAVQVTRIEKNHEDGNHLPLFQTGSGRSIAISKSSFKRATAVLEPRNITKELEDEAHLDGGHDTPMFKTGLGRSNLASDGCRTELCILEAEEAVKSVNNYNREAFVEVPAFQAGIQTFVPQNRSSSRKASMLLEQRNFTEKDNHNLLNMDKNIPVFASPLKTSCARTVNISSAGVSRAATLLGLEENTLSTQFFGHVGDKLGTKIKFERKNPEQRLASGPTENQVRKEPHRPFELSNNTVSDSGEHSIRFSTAGGRSMAISSDALQRARSLLGESDHVVSTNNLVGCSLASACNVEMPNSTVAPKGGPDLSKISRVNGKTELTTFSHQAMSDRKHTGSFENAVPVIPATNKQPNMFHVGSRSISEIPKIPKPSSMCLSETDNANDTKDKTQRLHMPAGALVDISNFMGTHSGNIDHAVNEKRRIEGRNTASSFKRPRSSR